MTIPTGTWIARTTASAEIWKPPAFGNGAHVLVSRVGQIARSTDDCQTFTEVVGPTTTGHWDYIVFDGTVHMILDNVGNFSTSSDGGLTWSAATAISGFSQDLGGVWVKGAGIYCVSNDYSATAVTTDHGATWTTGSVDTGGNWMGPAWDPVNNLWCVVNGASGSAAVSTSPDFVTWTSTANMPSGAGYWSAPAYAGAGRLVCVNSGSKEGFVATTLYAYSTDGGLTWTGGTLPVSKQWLGPVSSDDYSTLLLIPYQDTPTLISTDKGATWTTGAALPTVASLLDFGFADGVFTATGRDGSFAAQNTFYCYYISVSSPDVTVAMTGSRGTSKAGTLGVAPTVAVSGNRATSAPGTMTASTAGVGANLRGSRITSARGVLAPVVTAQLAGSRASTASGTLGKLLDANLRGSRITPEAGTVTGQGGNRVLAGQRLVTAAGKMSPSTNGSPPVVFSLSPSRLRVSVPAADNMVVATYPITPATVGQPPASLPTTFLKAAVDVQDYAVDFSGYLAAVGDSARAGFMTPPPGITMLSASLSQNVVRGWFSGGSAGGRYTIRVVLETSGGRARESEFSIRITGG